MNIELMLISDVSREQGHDYTERLRTYKCPCGKGEVEWSKERPNGNGYGYQASYSYISCNCDICKDKYDFKTNKGFAI